jgi:hypothetical protein
MKTTQSPGTHPDHRTVADSFQFKINGKAMAISFTDQRQKLIGTESGCVAGDAATPTGRIPPPD